jgi:hypothetical protein
MTPICTFSSCILRGLLMMAREYKPRTAGGIYVDTLTHFLAAAHARGVTLVPGKLYRIYAKTPAAPFVIPFAVAERALRNIGGREAEITLSLGAPQAHGPRSLIVDDSYGTQQCDEVAGEFPHYLKHIPRCCSGIAAQFDLELQALQRRSLATILGKQPKNIAVCTKHNGMQPAIEVARGSAVVGILQPLRLSAQPLSIDPDVDEVVADALQAFGVRYEIFDSALCA